MGERRGSVRAVAISPGHEGHDEALKAAQDEDGGLVHRLAHPKPHQNGERHVCAQADVGFNWRVGEAEARAAWRESATTGGTTTHRRPMHR